MSSRDPKVKGSEAGERLHNDTNNIGRVALGLPAVIYQPRVDLSSPWAIEEANRDGSASERARKRARQEISKVAIAGIPTTVVVEEAPRAADAPSNTWAIVRGGSNPVGSSDGGCGPS